MNTHQVARGAFGVAGLLLAAEAAGRTGMVDTRIVPLASTVLTGAVRLVTDTEFLQGVAATLQVWAGGILVAVLLAVPVGFLLGSLPAVETALRSVIEILRPIPSVALIPLVTVLITSDSRVKITIIAYAACWPVLINTIYGLHDVDPLAKQTLRTFGFGRLSVLLRVALPSSAPFVMTGVRVSASIALIVAISTELIAGGTDGIGIFIAKAGSAYRIDVMLAATLWAGLLGLAVNSLLVGAERRLFRWHLAKTGVTA